MDTFTLPATPHRLHEEIAVIPIRKIRPYKNQPRKYFDEAELDNLANCMTEFDQAMPCIVRPISLKEMADHEFELIDGERRYRSALRKGITELSCIIRHVRSEREQFIQSLIANFGRQGHPPLETAYALENAKRHIFGDAAYGEHVLEKLAKMCSRSPAWVAQHLSLLKLSPEVQAMMDPTRPRENRLTFQVAIALTNFAPELQLRLAREVLGQELSLKRALAYIQANTSNKDRIVKTGGRNRKPSDNFYMVRAFIRRTEEETSIRLEGSGTDLAEVLANRQPHEMREMAAKVDVCIRRLMLLRDACLKASAPEQKAVQSA